MKIGINTLFLVPGDVGGTETYLRKTLQVMAREFRDIPLVLFTTLDNDWTLKDDLKNFSQIEFSRLGFKAARRPVRIIAEQSLLPTKVREAEVDVLWSPGYTAPALCGCPQVVTVHDLQYKSHPDDLSFLERKTMDILVKDACRRAKAIITVSRFAAQEVIRHKFAPTDKVFPILNGVDPSFADEILPDEVAETRAADIGLKGAPYILCVAHTYPHKNVHLLVEAYGAIQDRIPHDLILVGKARRGEESVIRSLGKIRDGKRVHRFDTLEFIPLKYLFQQADLFVLPSLYEGFGLPVLEAMMAGTLVITSNRASIPEIGGDKVFYCDPLDKEHLSQSILNALELSEQEKQDLIIAAKRRAEEFVWEKTARETMQVLQNVAASG